MDWERVKQQIGAFAATLAPQSGLIGLGSGSTSIDFVKAFATMYTKGRYTTQCLATSLETELLAKTHGLPILNFKDWNSEVDVTFDGADAIDQEGTAIKGAGGALLREKIIANSSKRVVYMVDERKWKKPWQECMLPLVAIPFGISSTLRELEKLGMRGAVRRNGEKPFLTNDGLYIIDIPLTFSLHSLARLDRQLKEIPGVVETGIFFHFATEIIIGYGDGKVEHRMVTV